MESASLVGGLPDSRALVVRPLAGRLAQNSGPNRPRVIARVVSDVMAGWLKNFNESRKGCPSAEIAQPEDVMISQGSIEAAQDCNAEGEGAQSATV
jgi:hypothetical protein